MNSIPVTASLLLLMATVILPAEQSTAVMLFDGTSLKGWEGDRSVWRVVDGAIVGGSLNAPIPKSDYLCSDDEYDDFELRITARIMGGSNAGVSFRSQRVPGSNEVGGYQADMGSVPGDAMSRISTVVPDDPSRPFPTWGSLLDEYRPTPNRYPDPTRPYRLVAVPPRSVVDGVLRANDWNDVAVLAERGRIRLKLNGADTVEFVETGSVPRTGRVCLQVHSGPPAEAWYRSVSLLRK